MASRIKNLDGIVNRLVDEHKKVTRNGNLLFAGWYDVDNKQGDVCLFEVYEDFPDPGIGKIETYLFPSSREFPIKGSLRLTITSPSELKEAASRDDAILAEITSSVNKRVLFPEDANWDESVEGLTK
ncbi:MAG: hypothetical protein NT018_06290 [Armatimonadetes bacterium]|nr:hypothetical protein [Armatimonadota bacterium]